MSIKCVRWVARRRKSQNRPTEWRGQRWNSIWPRYAH